MINLLINNSLLNLVSSYSLIVGRYLFLVLSKNLLFLLGLLLLSSFPFCFNSIQLSTSLPLGCILFLFFIFSLSSLSSSSPPFKYLKLFLLSSSLASSKSLVIDLLISSTVKGLKFYGLVEKLSNTLHKRIDLLDKDQLVANPELLDEVLKDGIKIYG